MVPLSAIPHEPPPIVTDRLILRAPRMSDLAASSAMWADPVVTRYIGGRPFTEEEVWTRMLRYVGLWSWLGFGYWAVEDKESGEFVGEAGFADFKREMRPSIRGMPELGWAFAPRVHGRGFATEAVQAALAWGISHIESDRTVCIINPDNRQSLRVAEKCGFREQETAIYKGHPVILFGRELKPRKSAVVLD
jgi:RimJ/RimL family protein N-acetyltransferase